MTNLILYSDIFGYMGACFLTLLTYPQVYYCFKKSTTEGISEWFIFFQFMTSFCFLIYGILLVQLPILIANLSAFIGSILLIIAKLKFKNKVEDS